jgi:hypothetical protein
VAAACSCVWPLLQRVAAVVATDARGRCLNFAAAVAAEARGRCL